MRPFSKRLARQLCTLGLLCFLCILFILSITSLTTTALSRIGGNRMNQHVPVVPDSFFSNLFSTSLFILFLFFAYYILNRCVPKNLVALILILYTAVSIWFVLAIGLLPRADSYIIIEASKAFAKGDYSPLQDAYFHRYSYQLGLCLIMETLSRVFPGINLNLAMQVINCFMSLITLCSLSTLSVQLIGDSQTLKASFLLYILFLPFLFFNTFVYGVLPMMAFYACAMLCFSLYVRRRKLLYAFAYALLLGISVLLKPNAIVIAIALFICTVIYTLNNQDLRLLACSVISLMLCILLPAAVNRYYELRSGISLLTDSSMLLRLAMGLQDSVIASGWYNGLLEEFWDLSITPAEEKAAALSMILSRFEEFRQSPQMFLAFVKEKFLTQWSEPTYDILWYACICAKSGRYNGLANMLFREGSSIRLLLEVYLNVFQQAVYLLSFVGSLRLFKMRNTCCTIMILPVSILGGFLYHMIFEAKSQYIFPYMLLLLPLAAHGLSTLSDLAGRKCKR